MAKLWKFTFNVMGIGFQCQILNESLGLAEKKAYELCAEKVSDMYQQEALDGDYLTDINVTNVHILTE